MNLPFYVVKAFSNDPFQGNPAGIVLLDQLLKKSDMQSIASINGFPETVFLYGQKSGSFYEIWWFTPSQEVYDAGHATLAAQFVLFEYIHTHDTFNTLTLNWDTGQRCVHRQTANTITYANRSPMISLTSAPPIPAGIDADFYTADDDLILVLDNSEAVKHYQPNLEQLSTLPYRGLAITSSDVQYDYCCRFFAPKYGVAEDYVTATAHKYLSHYWSTRKRLSAVTGVQYSRSPGVVRSQIASHHVYLSGDCRIYSKGTLTLR